MKSMESIESKNKPNSWNDRDWDNVLDDTKERE